MAQEKPQKPKRRRSKKLNVSNKKEWERILKDVDKKDVPISMLEAITVNLKDGTQVVINIQELLLEEPIPIISEIISKRDWTLWITSSKMLISTLVWKKCVKPFNQLPTAY